MAANPTFVDVPELIVTNFNPAQQAGVIFQAGPKGARVYGISATSTDTITTTVNIYLGDILTDNALGYPDYRPNSPARRAIWPDIRFTNTTNATITRQSGSFLNDGWLIRDFVFTDGCNSNPLNQVIQQITSAVAALTLTFTGAALFNAADTTPGAAVRLIRVTELIAAALVSGAGNTAAVTPVVFMSSTTMPQLATLPDTAFYLRPYQCLVAKVPTVTAAKQVNMQVWAGQL